MARKKIYDTPTDNADGIVALYREFGPELLEVRKELASLYTKMSNPMFDDVEAELLYLLIREHKPVSAVEVSSGCGWSTSWILSGLRDNHMGYLTSCDFTDAPKRVIPVSVHDNRWDYLKGDVRELYKQFPSKIDFLLEDSEHTDTFNTWFGETFFPALTENSVLCVHDVFMALKPRHSDALVLFDWASRNGKKFWTPASAMQEQWLAIQAVRSEIGITHNIHFCETNPMAVVEL